MKVATLIARILLGLVFVFFGSNAFLNFIHAPLPDGLAGQFLSVLIQSHYVYFVGGVQAAGGALFLVNRYVKPEHVVPFTILLNAANGNSSP